MGISLEDMEDASVYYEEQGDAQVHGLLTLATQASQYSCLFVLPRLCRHARTQVLVRINM